MGKSHQTTKHRKQQKKELANRKARQLATQQAQPVAEPMSPARRAFQDK